MRAPFCTFEEEDIEEKAKAAPPTRLPSIESKLQQIQSQNVMRADLVIEDEIDVDLDGMIRNTALCTYALCIVYKSAESMVFCWGESNNG